MRQADLHEQPYDVLRDQVRTYYDNFLSYLEQDLTHTNPRHARVLAALEKLARPGSRVLDLGCGIGITTRALREMTQQAEVVGVDLSPALIGKAQTLSDATFLVADVTELALDRHFDLLCMVDALEHISPRRYEALWDVFAAHAAPGALLYLNLPNPKLLETLQEESPEALQILDESVPIEEMIRLAYARGFQLLALNTYALWRPEEYLELVFRAPGVAEVTVAPPAAQSAAAPPAGGDGLPGSAPAVHTASLSDAPLRLGVWAGDGNNTHFLEPILERLPARYEVVRMGEGGTPDEIGRGLKSVDAAWFEWATGPALAGSARAQHVPTVVRLHRYEAYTETPRHIQWGNIDDLVFISEGVRRSFGEMHPDALASAKTRVHVVPNGIDVDTYPFEAEKVRNHRIAFVGRLHLVKNPMLLVQLMGALVKREPRFELHIAGATQHPEVARYLRYHAEQTGLDKHMHHYGHLDADELRNLLKQCTYLVTTSVIEGHPVGVMEGMAMGLKPVIHDFYGARDLFEAGMLYNTVDEAVRIITRGSYEPETYRRFVADRYSLDAQVSGITSVLDRAVTAYQPARMARLLEAPPTVFGEDAQAALNRAQLYAEAGNFKQALAACDGVDFASLGAADQVPARVVALQLALACGAPTEALRHADAATDLAPAEPLLLNLAGRALWAAGQKQSALETLVYAAEQAETTGPHLLDFDAVQIRQDAFDACSLLGMNQIAHRFAAPVTA